MTLTFDLDELSKRIAEKALSGIEKRRAGQSIAGDGGLSIDRDDVFEAIETAAQVVILWEERKQTEADGQPSAKANGGQSDKAAARKAGITITGL